MPIDGAAYEARMVTIGRAATVVRSELIRVVPRSNKGRPPVKKIKVWAFLRGKKVEELPTDSEIARMIGCMPVTVAQVRKSMGMRKDGHANK